MQIKQLKINFNQEKEANKNLQSKVFDREEEFKNVQTKLKEIQTKVNKSNDTKQKMQNFYKNISSVAGVYDNMGSKQPPVDQVLTGLPFNRENK